MQILVRHNIVQCDAHIKERVISALFLPFNRSVTLFFSVIMYQWDLRTKSSDNIYNYPFEMLLFLHLSCQSAYVLLCVGFISSLQALYKCSHRNPHEAGCDLQRRRRKQ